MVSVDEYGLVRLPLDEYIRVFDSGGELSMTMAALRCARLNVGGYVIIKTEHPTGKYMSRVRVLDISESESGCVVKVLPCRG